MASITAATSVQIASLLAAARKADLDIQKLGQGKYQGADINDARAAEIDANLTALKAAVTAITG
uniref:Uncharacterized protein n=4 Tax=unclassified bacterial viruses TaxID=12333 RepID=A0AAU6W0X8_9VIRU